MIETDRFLGEPFSYWIDLQRRMRLGPDAVQVDHLLKELIVANAKVHYYELQIQRLNQYREAAK